MENLIFVGHVIVAFAIIGLIMLQQGKGAEMGASFGSGSSQTVFGPAGTGNLFSTLTAILATVFFASSFGLAILAKNSSEIEADGFVIPEVETASQEIGQALSADSIDVADQAEALESAAAALEDKAKELKAEGASALESSEMLNENAE